MDYGVRVIRKDFITPMDAEILTRDHGVMKGQYMFTIDNYHELLTSSIQGSVRPHRSTNPTTVSY